MYIIGFTEEIVLSAYNFSQDSQHVKIEPKTEIYQTIKNHLTILQLSNTE